MATGLNIVVVEDNQDLREAVVEVLGTMGHQAIGLSCAEELGDEGARAQIDLLVVDLNLPGEDGVSLARRLRLAQPGLHIIMITARASVYDKVAGYEAGADIYLTKPVSVEEFGAAVRSLERRLSAQRMAPDPESALSVQLEAMRAFGPSGAVELSAMEVELLSALARAPERRLAYWQLLEIMARDADTASLTNLAVRMTRLRKKIQATGFAGPTLRVIRHEGYQLRIPVQLV